MTLLYLDTSALLKLYVDEPGSLAVRQLPGGQAMCTCRITWAEACAALARREREAANADLLVVPSKGGEGTPRVLVEARAFGCPVIGTRVCGIPSSIDDGVDGLLVPPADATSLANAMLRIASDSALRQRLIEGGIERARRTTVDAMADAILSQAEMLYANQHGGRSRNVNPPQRGQASITQNLTLER